MSSKDDITTISMTEMATKGIELIRSKKSFEVCSLADMKADVKRIENLIESNNLTCRVYTAKRSAALAAGFIPTGITQLTAIGTAIGIAAHNLATWNPDYEIVKYIIDHKVKVEYKKK